jgi:hypothetical protein
VAFDVLLVAVRYRSRIQRSRTWCIAPAEPPRTLLRGTALALDAAPLMIVFSAFSWAAAPGVRVGVRLAGGPPLLLACSVAIVDDEPLLAVAAPALAELPRANAARIAPPIMSCLSRFRIILFLAVVRDVPGYECHDGRKPFERRERYLRISKERSRRARSPSKIHRKPFGPS